MILYDLGIVKEVLLPSFYIRFQLVGQTAFRQSFVCCLVAMQQRREETEKLTHIKGMARKRETGRIG